MFLRVFLKLISLVLLIGCSTGAESIWSTDAEVDRAFYKHNGPPTITLFTVVSNTNDSGAHSALMISGSQRIIFDPAGSWHHPRLPERNDVHFGMTDAAVDFYVDYHSRVTYHTVIQKIVVSEGIAQLAMDQIMSYGAVPKSQCSKSITEILARLPGFESVGQTWFPKKLMEKFGELPGVTTETIYDNDPDNNTGFITAYGI